jgi:hypothetical protein
MLGSSQLAMMSPPSPLTDGFASLIAPFDIALLERMPATVAGLSPDGRIAYLNPAWHAFGDANGTRSSGSAGAVGNVLLLATPPVLRPFYEKLFADATATGEVGEHDYECSSPEQCRTFRMRVHPCASGALVIVNSLLREAPHAGAACPPLERFYRDAHGLVVQCSNCRRVRRATPSATEPASATWDWVPEYVAHMPAQTSHAICMLCAQFYYG